MLAGTQIDPSSGAEVGSSSLLVNPQGPGNTNWSFWSIQPLRGANQDLVFVAGRSTDSANPNVQGTQETVQVQAFRFDRSVTPPVLTFIGVTNVNTGIAFDPFARQLPLATEIIGNRLYVATFYENLGGRISRFDVDPVTGALNSQATAFDYVGQSPEWLLQVFHPTAGQLMFVATIQGPESRLETFQVDGLGNLTQLFSTGPVTAFYRSILDFTAPNSGGMFLAVLTIQGVSVFSLDATTAQPTLLQSTDITNSASITK